MRHFVIEVLKDIQLNLHKHTSTLEFIPSGSLLEVEEQEEWRVWRGRLSRDGKRRYVITPEGGASPLFMNDTELFELLKQDKIKILYTM